MVTMTAFPVSFLARIGVIFCALVCMVKSDSTTCDIDIENTLKTLLTPQESPTMQLQALRRDVLRRLQEALEKAHEEDEMTYKRSMSSLARWDNLPADKRNMEALARAGYIRTLPDSTDEDQVSSEDPDKRSIANLAKNGQLPTFQNNESKRGIESLARNGELHRRKDVQELLDELYDKRNIGSLARNFNFPSYGKRFIGSLARSGDLPYKRNIASLARDGTKLVGKRNVAALLRQDNYLNSQLSGQPSRQNEAGYEDEKRNLASIKAQGYGINDRTKRQADYYDVENDEYPSPVYQNQNVYDYEELLKALTGVYPNTEKRFLGSVAKTGWFRPSSSRYTRFETPEKRHIGSLARLGWLPTLRNVRRFNRSYRSTMNDATCREAASDGEAEDNTIPEDPSSSLDEGKRFLLQPAVDRILLRKIFMHPKTHPMVTHMS